MRHRKIRSRQPAQVPPWLWPLLLCLWCVLLCLVPDPRPLGAPDWAVDAVHRLLGVSEATSRALATIALRACGLTLIGVLLCLSLLQLPLKIAAPVVLLFAPILAMLCQWVNYGYFPIFIQVQLGVISSIVGAVIGLGLRRDWLAGGWIAGSWIAGTVLITMLAILYLWGTATGISNDLADDARVTGEHLLANAASIPDGDEGFVKLLELAFSFAKDNSHGTDAANPNKAAILALGVILGEERVAKVAKRPIQLQRIEELNALRQRITIKGRNDLARHFWVSAALVILSDENRSMTVGISKEMMDATAGGSGFSFVDLTADRAGTLFATAATKNGSNARNMQTRISQGIAISDFFPSIEGLPEGLTSDVFLNEYGGLGGKETLRLAQEIERRIATCQALQTIQ